MINAEKLTKIYKSGDLDIFALDNVSLNVKEGEFIAITGRSGSGKSTLLYQLGLIDFPTSGTVCLNDIDTASLDNNKRTLIRLNELGYVFQDYALIPELTAIENIMITLLMRGISYKEAKEKSKVALERFGLVKRMNNLPNQLSGGEQQRVSIARAIVNKPHILFADEPTANLDTENAESVLEVFKELHKEGQTIIMVTHEEEYTKVADRIITISDGKIISDIKN